MKVELNSGQSIKTCRRRLKQSSLLILLLLNRSQAKFLLLITVAFLLINSTNLTTATNTNYRYSNQQPQQQPQQPYNLHDPSNCQNPNHHHQLENEPRINLNNINQKYNYDWTLRPETQNKLVQLRAPETNQQLNQQHHFQSHKHNVLLIPQNQLNLLTNRYQHPNQSPNNLRYGLLFKNEQLILHQNPIKTTTTTTTTNARLVNFQQQFQQRQFKQQQQQQFQQIQNVDIDECQDERACGRGAVCENLPGSFRCSCPPGFTGDPSVECIDMDECRNNPCGIGAQCTNIPGGYRCSCAPGFQRNPALPANLFGTIQTTALTTTREEQQQQQQTDLTTNSSIIACLDINECNSQGNKQVCGLGAQCVNTPGAFFCQCPPNFTGNPKVACQDIDECQNHACGPNSLCKNTPGSYKCDCKQGYTGNAYLAEGCQDEDECLRKDACGINAQCFNTDGSYQCTCLNGYVGDPYSKCVDVDECASRNNNPCGPGAQCENLEGGYKCSCPDKYLARGTPEMGCERAAVDIGCLIDQDCTTNALCLNSTCQCKLGYKIQGIDCVDVDECTISQPSPSPPLPIKPFTKISSQINFSASNHSGICGSAIEASCLNTDGSYVCNCLAGYEKLEPQSMTSKCKDINECESNLNACGQNSKCFNTEGGFKCACSDGFIPIDQEPANGCKSPCDGIDCGKHATCKPHGEEAACVCKPGFTFDPNNIKLGCVDINECDTNYGPAGLCGQRAICSNIPGSYRCNCPAGYSGDAYRYCEDINECDRRYGIFGQCGELAICNNTAGSFSCSCAPGYQGDPRVKCHDVDECLENNANCGLNAICTNLPGKFSCKCPEGFTGDPMIRCQPEAPSCSTNADCPTNMQCQSGRCNCPFSNNQQNHNEPHSSLECRHPCDKTECGLHATCQLDPENQALCVCDAGYMAPSDGRSGCIDVNECIQGVALTGITPISVLSSTRNNQPQAGVAVTVSPGLSAPGGSANGSHPCGRNALCHNLPGTFDCVCPPGYSGDAYQACTLDVRNQQIITSNNTTSTTTSTTSQVSSSQQQQQQQHNLGSSQQNQNTGNAFGNYLQEPRTSTCNEPCPRGTFCSEGQCVKPDSCRDNLDCKPTMACEHINQAIGFQCVNVCELNQCGPEAKCNPLNHKPVCSCNTSAGYTGDPYDLINGCQLFQIHDDNQATKTTSAENILQTTLNTKSDMEVHRPTYIDNQQQQVTQDISSNNKLQQQQMVNTSTTSIVDSQGLTKLQSQSEMSHHRDQEATVSSRKPPVVTYELPLPTTPFNQPGAGGGPYAGHTQSPFGFQQQQNEAKQSISSNAQSSGSKSSTASIQTTTKQNLFGVSQRKPTQPPIVQLPSNNRQDSLEGGEKVQQQQQQQDSFNQFNNKSAMISQSQFLSNTQTNLRQQQQQQLSCTNDQHCPGNLFCLSDSASGRKLCGCPLGYRREADYCYMARTNCTSSSICRAREECISSALLTQTGAGQQFNLQTGDEFTGICICPRGYKLIASGIACIDRNECDEGTPCAVGAICQNKIGSYECVCPPGTQGEPYTKTCEPISRQECQSNLDCANDRECDLASRKCISPCHVCGPRAICTATNHAAICLCPPRFTGNAIDPVYGCQEPAPATTTTSSYQQLSSSSTTVSPRPTPSRIQESNTAVGIPVTTLLPSSSLSTTTTTTQAPSTALDSTTTTQSVEFRTIPPSELFVMCLADGIQVELQLGGFDGIIYVKGHSQDPKCRKLVMSSSASEFVDFKVNFGNCDLIHRDGEAGFVLVIQKHPKLVTYRARAYHVKCVYNTGERTVTLGFNVSMITTSGTIANTGPPPTCLMSITALNGHEVTSAEIGQDLLLRVDVQPDAIYGGFARSCEAKTMDDEGEYQYEVTDANGCATDPSIFSDWKYDQSSKSLIARFNAFKFPSSNNLRFQCNIRVCFGSCPAVNCNGVDAYGRRRRRRRRRSAMAIDGENSNFNLTNNQEDELTAPGSDELIVSDAFKEGALREEIMIQSNAILTFDKKEASLAQKRPQVEEIEFVCLPRLGIFMSIVLTTLIALLALAIATSCWCFNKRRFSNRSNGPLPHPINFPNPLMRSTCSSASSTSSLTREPIYGP